MKLNSVTWGCGPKRAVFLHGFAGSAHAFDHLEPLLGDRFTATCIELPGHAESSLATSWDETVSTVGALLPRDSVLIGYSQGARVALGVALQRREDISHLVLESGAAGFRRRHERLLRRRSDEGLAQLLETRGVEAFIDSWERQPLFSGLRQLPAVDQAALRARRVGQTAAGLASALRALGQGAQPDLWPALPGLRVPTLLITGALDEKYTRIARKLNAELSLSWRVAIRGAGHAPHLEAPEAYADELRSFLAPAWLDSPQELAP